MIALFYDTETTGLPLFDEPSEDPRQPHIAQLAAALGRSGQPQDHRQHRPDRAAGRLVDAHQAMADVRGCMDVYFAIRDRAAATTTDEATA